MKKKKISEHNEEEKQKEKAYNTSFFILNMPREKLYEKIDLRVDLMIKNGLLKEVSYLLEKNYNKEAIYIIKRDTRHFAKRQLTWFKNQAKDAIWLDTTQFENTKSLINKMMEYL